MGRNVAKHIRQTMMVGKGYQAVGTITDPMQIRIEPKPTPELDMADTYTAEADFAIPIIDRKPMNHYDMVASQGKLTILDKEDYDSDNGPKLDLTPYMAHVNDTKWTIDNSVRIDYLEDSAEIANPSLKVRLAVDMLVWKNNHFGYTITPGGLLADLKHGLSIEGPGGDDYINLAPYVQTESIELGLNKRTLSIGNRDMFIESEHMFILIVTFKPQKLTVLGRRNELVK